MVIFTLYLAWGDKQYLSEGEVNACSGEMLQKSCLRCLVFIDKQDSRLIFSSFLFFDFIES